MPSRPRIGGHRVLTGWAMLVYAFLYAPIVVVVIFAFNSNQHVTVWDGFTTHWFGDAWNNPVYRSALTTSLRIALASSIIATVLGTAAALALSRMHRRWRAPFDALVYLTLVVPEIVIAVASLIFFVRFHARASDFPQLGHDRRQGNRTRPPLHDHRPGRDPRCVRRQRNPRCVRRRHRASPARQTRPL